MLLSEPALRLPCKSGERLRGSVQPNSRLTSANHLARTQWMVHLRRACCTKLAASLPGHYWCHANLCKQAPKHNPSKRKSNMRPASSSVSSSLLDKAHLTSDTLCQQQVLPVLPMFATGTALGCARWRLACAKPTSCAL